MSDNVKFGSLLLLAFLATATPASAATDLEPVCKEGYTEASQWVKPGQLLYDPTGLVASSKHSPERIIGTFCGCMSQWLAGMNLTDDQLDYARFVLGNPMSDARPVELAFQGLDEKRLRLFLDKIADPLMVCSVSASQ